MIDAKLAKNTIVHLLPFLVVLAGLFVLYVVMDNTRQFNKEVAAYVHVQDCILAQNSNERTQADVERCYKVVQDKFDVTLFRYDKL